MNAIHIFGVLCLSAAFFLLLFVSLSLPVIKSIDFLDVRFSASIGSLSVASKALRFGNWGWCYGSQCTKAHLGFNTGALDRITSDKVQDAVSIIHTLSNGFVLNPIACGFCFWALLFALGTHFIAGLLGSLFAFIAFVVTLLAFSFDLGVFVTAKHRLNKIDDVDAKLGKAVWMMVAAMILQLISAVTVCFTHHDRRNRNVETGTGGWFRRWRQQRAAQPVVTEKGRFWKRPRRTTAVV